MFNSGGGNFWPGFTNFAQFIVEKRLRTHQQCKNINILNLHTPYHHMITKKLVPALGISVALLAACTDQVPEIPASELYTRAFVKEFGVVNGSQDWNNATQGSVNVSVEGQAAVQVTAKINGRY